MTVYNSSSVEETEALACEFAKTLKGGDVVALFGGLGAGKTAFVRGLCRGLGIDDDVSSPTFALVHEYGKKTRLCHFDMYRINSFDDLYSTGFYDYLDSGAILAVEWSENIESFLPDGAIRIDISRGAGDNERIITVCR
ncbi:MAG: tRNA (adenosine(37)-N6)-threonylcarbamoyltransferase complex ATPase subunit type 1 TsaE [Clostridiales bacterium]|nr:tRNA (adenosine(37)-N6)-threonylcarbamoyltransferase complex ATPase subunit type 1 TsaE [Clostridiales bacterium]